MCVLCYRQFIQMSTSLICAEFLSLVKCNEMNVPGLQCYLLRPQTLPFFFFPHSFSQRITEFSHNGYITHDANPNTKTKHKWYKVIDLQTGRAILCSSVAISHADNPVRGIFIKEGKTGRTFILGYVKHHHAKKQTHRAATGYNRKV